MKTLYVCRRWTGWDGYYVFHFHSLTLCMLSVGEGRARAWEQHLSVCGVRTNMFKSGDLCRRTGRQKRTTLYHMLRQRGKYANAKRPDSFQIYLFRKVSCITSGSRRVESRLAIFSYSPFIHDILVRSLHTFSGNIYHYTQLFSSKLSTLVKNVSAPTSEM